MGVVFRELTINVSSMPGRKRRESATALFRGRVLRAQAALKGFKVCCEAEDREVLAQQISLDVTDIRDNAVTIAANFELRDSTGALDGRYNGSVRAVVIAEVP